MAVDGIAPRGEFSQRIAAAELLVEPVEIGVIPGYRPDLPVRIDACHPADLYPDWIIKKDQAVRLRAVQVYAFFVDDGFPVHRLAEVVTEIQLVLPFS